MKKVALSFDEAAAIQDADIGAKARGLLRLADNGFLVPSGFIVTAEAYRHHLRKIGLPSGISTEDLTGIGQRITQTPIEPALVEQIERCYLALPKAAVAVRSSGLAEDLPTQSFAGQYETFLNIQTWTDCLHAIQKCWASAWSPRAVSYRRRNGIDHAAAAMAVIVQPMVQADCAGVVFTADPVTGDENRLIIECCAGLGDKLVSGQIKPDRCIFEKNSMTLVQVEAADKTRSSSLDPLQARRLAKSAIEIETILGGPQDIEWAMQDGVFYFLQCRPITTLKEQCFEDRQVWTNMNTGEVLPDVVTPATWSLVNQMFKPLFRSVWRMIGTDLEENIVAGLVAGRVYFNVNTGIAAVRHLPPFIQKKLAADDLLGGRLSGDILSGRLKFRPEDLPDVKGSLWKLIVRIPETLYQGWRHRGSKSLEFIEYLRQVDRQLASINLPALPDAQLSKLFHETIDRELKKWDILFIGSAMALYPAFRHFCQKRLADANGSIAHQLIRGQAGMEDVQAGFDLWNLAVTASKSDPVRQAIWSANSFAELEPALQASEPGRDFLQNWNAFMEEHGHHCRGELELSNARWCQQPDYVLGLVRNYLSGIGQTDPVKKYRQMEGERTRLYEKCLGQLRNPVHRWLLKFFIRRIRFGMMLRENWKSRAVRLLFHLRRMLLEMDRRLVARQILESQGDVFFLTIEEIGNDFESIRSLRPQIQSRKLEYQANCRLSPPHVVIGRYRPEETVETEIAADERTLRGLAVCPGRVTGKARVILRANETEQVLAGEILVAPFTDPAWTPCFLTAAGVVMDMGGLLSHGSIVAREYGLPAVVNVGPATHRIKTGQLIEVDGDNGIVRILS